MALAKSMIFSGYYEWLERLTLTERLFLTLVFSGLTGLFAQFRIALPFTPIPLTGQVFAVLLSGIILKGVYGGLAMLFYLLLGFAGLPWFSGFKPGLPIGPTTGYIIGFIPAALFVGLLGFQSSRFINQLLVMFVAVLIIYCTGTLHLALFMNLNLSQALFMGVLPFIPLDLVKVLIVASISRFLVIASGIGKR